MSTAPCGEPSAMAGNQPRPAPQTIFVSATSSRSSPVSPRCSRKSAPRFFTRSSRSFTSTGYPKPTQDSPGSKNVSLPSCSGGGACPRLPDSSDPLGGGFSSKSCTRPPARTTSMVQLACGRSLNSNSPLSSENQRSFLNSFFVVPPPSPSLPTAVPSFFSRKGHFFIGVSLGPTTAPSKVSLSGLGSSSSFFVAFFFVSSCGSSPGRRAPAPFSSNRPFTLPSGTSAFSSESPLSSLKVKLPSTRCQDPAHSLSVPGLSEARIGSTHFTPASSR